MTAPRPPRSRQRGFTLLEVMIALAILASALTILVRSVGTNVKAAQDAESLTIVTTLCRAKMGEIEETLIKDGFLETDQSTDGDFTEQGWPEMTWHAQVDKVEIPSFDALQAMQNTQTAGSGAGSGSGSGSSVEGGFADSALGGMLGLLGGPTDAASAAGGSFIQQQFSLVQEVLKASIRKVTLTVKWKVMGNDRDLSVVAYFTDPEGMNKVIGSLGQQEPTGTEDPTTPTPTPTPTPTR